MLSSVAWSIGTSKRGNANVSHQNFPGPGTYTPYKHHNFQPSEWRFGSDAFRQTQHGHAKQPGPGEYQPGNQTFRHFPEYVMGLKTKYGNTETLNSPGPGEYNQDQHSVKYSSPTYQFGLKTMGSEKGFSSYKSPGPAAYDHDTRGLNKRPSSRMSRDKRKTTQNNDSFTPGVGEYKIAKKVGGPQYGFGTQARCTSASNMSTPGPGAYNIRSLLKDCVKTMGLRKLLSSNVDRKPGPGAYTPYKHHNSTPSEWKFGSETYRHTKHQNEKQPGPGEYAPGNKNFRHFPEYQIGQKTKYGTVDALITPGPGEYNQDQNQVRHTSPTYQFGQKTQSEKGFKEYKSPGPAAYDHDTKSINKRPSSRIT